MYNKSFKALAFVLTTAILAGLMLTPGILPSRKVQATAFSWTENFEDALTGSSSPYTSRYGMSLTAAATNKVAIISDPEGLNQVQAQGQYTPVVGGMTPHLIMDKYEVYFTSPATIEGGKITNPFIPKELWMFTYTKDENDKMISINTDINNYVNEMIIKFVTGSEPLSNWDAYVKKLDTMGLKDIIAIQNAALQRWNSNK